VAAVVVEPEKQFVKWVHGLQETVPPDLEESVPGSTESNPTPVGAGGA